MKLYSFWRSSAAYRVRIALNVKRLAYDIVPVSLVADGGEQKKAEYRRLNPQMLVPFMQDGDVGIGQSQAIFEYLEDRYPTPPLLPADAAGRARVRSITNAICCDVHPLNNLRVINYLKDTLAVPEDKRDAWVVHWITVGFTAIEALLAPHAKAGPYCFGKEVTLADVCLVPQLYNARRFKVPLDGFPRIVAVGDACNQLTAFIDAAPERQPEAQA